MRPGDVRAIERPHAGRMKEEPAHAPKGAGRDASGRHRVRTPGGIVRVACKEDFSGPGTVSDVAGLLLELAGFDLERVTLALERLACKERSPGGGIDHSAGHPADHHICHSATTDRERAERERAQGRHLTRMTAPRGNRAPSGSRPNPHRAPRAPGARRAPARAKRASEHAPDPLTSG